MTGIHPEYWGMISYSDAMARMDQAWRLAHEHGAPGAIFYLEHEEVITCGRATPPSHLHRIPHDLPVHEAPRGGLATYHGPGQLAGYCVIDLKRRAGPMKPDIHEFIRAIEEGISRFLVVQHQISCYSREGLTGVWTGSAESPRKIASIGISVRRWITTHGFALNVEPDLARFECIVPCGNSKDEMTSIRRECELAGRQYDRLPQNLIAAQLHECMKAALAEKGWLE
ncbi:MAG: lipoyl(octanoyl) transferase LipB [bacterium]|nr:lipoyl(octanoyl) transferase LipB [Candidatus Sumerlaeota bacterium]